MHPRERKETGVVLMKGAAAKQGPPKPIDPEGNAKLMLLLTMIALILWFVSVEAHCQTPDAPGYATRPHVAGECGPKWMGGCWSFDRPQLTWGEAARSKKFWIPTTVFTLSAGWDYATTAYFSRYGHYLGDPKNSPCMERNQDLGQRPGAGDFAKNFATTHLPVIALGLVATKLKVPHWIYDGAVVYGTQVHIRGAIGWYRDCW